MSRGMGEPQVIDRDSRDLVERAQPRGGQRRRPPAGDDEVEGLWRLHDRLHRGALRWPVGEFVEVVEESNDRT
jgi:hypothetical protein